MFAALSMLATICFGAPMASSDTPFHIIKRIPVGGEGGWDYLTVDSAARRLYLSRGRHVMVVNLQTDKIEGDIPNTPGVHGIAIVSDLGRGFISNGGDSTVTIFDLKTLKETSRVKVGSRPDAIIYDPASKRVFTFNAGSSDTTAIDAAAGTVAGSVPLGGKPEAAAADGKGTIFVNVEDKNEVIAFDSKTLTAKHHWPLSPGEQPTGLALDQKHHRLFSACHNKKMIVLDSETGKVIATPDIGDGTDGAAFDEKESLAFSSNGDGTLTIVKEQSPDKFAVLETVTTEPGARTIALDPRTHHIYLVTAKLQPPPPGTDPNARRRRTYEPGSFVVLVVGK